MFFEMVFANEVFEMLAQFSLAEDHESRIGQLLHDEVRRFNQVPMTLVRDERAHVADDRRMMRKKERLVNVDGRSGEHMLDVDAFVHRDDMRFGNTIGDEHRADRVGCRDEAVDLSVFPSRKRVALEMKVDPARCHERRRPAAWRRPAAERQGERRHRHAVWIVGVYHVGLETFHDSGETPGGGKIHFRSRRNRDQFESFVDPPAQLSVRMGHERRPMTDRSQAVHRQQDLVLSAAPGSGCVDVQGEHLRFWGSGFWGSGF